VCSTFCCACVPIDLQMLVMLLLSAMAIATRGCLLCGCFGSYRLLFLLMHGQQPFCVKLG
jgi:hypothetical protein